MVLFQIFYKHQSLQVCNLTQAAFPEAFNPRSGVDYHLGLCLSLGLCLICLSELAEMSAVNFLLINILIGADIPSPSLTNMLVSSSAMFLSH